MGEEDFCRYIRQRWGDAYADGLEQRVSEAENAWKTVATIQLLPLQSVLIEGGNEKAAWA